MQSRMKPAFVLTNFNNSSYTVQAVESIVSHSRQNTHIVIVDNNSDKKNTRVLKELHRSYDSLDIIYNTKNLGYFQGLNAGIRFVKTNCPEYGCIAVGNNDLVFSCEFFDAFPKVEHLFKRYPVISPDIVTLDGFHQNPHVIHRVSRFREFIYDLYYTNYYLACLIKMTAHLTKSFTDRKDERQYAVGQEIQQGYGACYILGPLFFRHFRELWTPSLLMYEELFLSKQLESRGFKVYYEPSISVKHHWHASVETIADKKRWLLARDSHCMYRRYCREGMDALADAGREIDGLFTC